MVYLDHKEMCNTETTIVDDNVCIPYYAYWNNAYAITPHLAKKLIQSPLRQNVIPVDEFFPLIQGVDYNKFSLNKNAKFIDMFQILKSKFANIDRVKAAAYVNSLFKQVPRVVLGSDIEDGALIMNQLATVLTVATDKTKFKYIETSSKTKGIELINLGEGVEWKGGNMSGPGGGQKINLVKEYLKNNTTADIVLFCDGHDVIINDDLTTIVERFKGFECDILFAAEKVCWPDSSIASTFPESPTAYRYLNSGVYIGYRESILPFIDHYIEDSEDDQLFLQKLYLNSLHDDKYTIKLDYENYIFQCCNSINNDLVLLPYKQFVNINTKCCPAILHGNGGIDDKIVFDNIFKQLYPCNLEFIEAAEIKVVAPDIIEMDFLTLEMCGKIIKMAEDHGNWKSMYGDKFPGQELRVREFSMELWNALDAHFKNSINPVIEKYWFPLLMYGLRDAFIIKYTPDTQKSLSCHHDASLVSAMVKLNGDYEGGDTFFYRQGYSNINTEIGKAILWPGQVTHGHEGREVVSGTKYNLVIWTNRNKNDINY
jgi:hypothetical protein